MDWLPSFGDSGLQGLGHQSSDRCVHAACLSVTLRSPNIWRKPVLGAGSNVLCSHLFRSSSSCGRKALRQMYREFNDHPKPPCLAG